MTVLVGTLLIGASAMSLFALIVCMVEPSLFKRSILGGGRRGNIAVRFALITIYAALIGSLVLDRSFEAVGLGVLSVTAFCGFGIVIALFEPVYVGKRLIAGEERRRLISRLAIVGIVSGFLGLTIIGIAGR